MAGLELYDAVMTGSLSQLKRLIKRENIDLNATFQEVRLETHIGMSPIHLASRNGYHRMVHFFIHSGCVVDVTTTNFRKTALHFAVQNQRFSCMMLLLRSGASVAVHDLFGNTPCHYSAEDGSCDILDVLIENGAKVDAQDVTCKTSLMKAVRNNRTEAVLRLLHAGADPNLIDSNNEIALHFAARNGFQHIINILICCGSLMDVQNCWGSTPLMVALCNNHTDCVKRLIDAGCDLTCQESKTGHTALHIAVKKNDTSLVHALLAAGAQHGIYNHQGESALFDAIALNKTNILRLMIDCNSKLDIPVCLIPDVLTKTAFQVAAEKGHLDTCRLLAELGHLDFSTQDLFYTHYLPARPVAQDAALAWLQEALHHVPSLQRLCRRTIRQCCDHKLSEKVESMPVPCKLKNYILFKDEV